MLKTRHNVYFCDARRMQMLPSASVDLIVTSPPYPMIQMWDAAFCQQDPRIADALAEGRSKVAHEFMHCLLDRVWDESFRVLKPGGFACINIGDATRSVHVAAGDPRRVDGALLPAGGALGEERFVDMRLHIADGDFRPQPAG